jgi:hypothetical protein
VTCAPRAGVAGGFSYDANIFQIQLRATPDREASMSDEVAENRFEVSILPELEGGVYASFANLWHGPDVFTIDFASLSAPPERVEDEMGTAFNRFQTRVVARVRIPPSQVFELMKALEIQLSAWETETGHKAV